MKLLTLLILFALSLGSFAQGESWVTLTRVGEELQLEAGEVALVAAVSEPIYLRIKRPQQSTKGVRLRPVGDRSYSYYRRGARDYIHRRVQPVSWHNPFPIAGPCTLRLGTSAAITIRLLSSSRN